MAYDICMRMKEEEVTGVSIECVVDSETGTLYAMKVVLEDETEPVTWDDIGADAPYYFITDYMQSYLHDYDSGTYIEIEGEMPYDTNAQIMWDKEAEIEAEIKARKLEEERKKKKEASTVHKTIKGLKGFFQKMISEDE
jgi:hypothetical protein